MRPFSRLPKAQFVSPLPHAGRWSRLAADVVSTLKIADRGRLGKSWVIALGAWLVALILTPIGLWTVGPEFFPGLAAAGVLAHALVTFLALALGKHIRWIFGVLVVVAGLSWGVEAVGVATGLPFGDYTYTATLRPQLLGVPVLIPIAWFMMIGPAWGVTEMILKEAGVRLGDLYWPAFAGLAGLIMTAWDLYLDPQMVSQGLWRWESGGGYFGIPWLNFIGWWLTAFVLTLLIRPANLPLRPLALIYTLTWIFQALALGLFWAQPGPALTGFFGMGVFVFLSWSQEVRRWKF